MPKGLSEEMLMIFVDCCWFHVIFLVVHSKLLWIQSLICRICYCIFGFCCFTVGIVLSHCVVSLSRHYGADCLGVCTRSWISGQCFCHLGHQEFEIPADPAHAAYGPAWRHLEAARICSLCPQQGDPETISFVSFSRSWLLLYWDTFLNFFR